jgi:hypothetical protein
MSRRPPSKGSARPEGGFAKLRAEIDHLRRELGQAQTRIEQLEKTGADPLVAKRLAELEEGQKVARGLAVDAAVARSRAEAELKTLRDAIEKASGLQGWLLRRALRRISGTASGPRKPVQSS